MIAKIRELHYKLEKKNQKTQLITKNYVALRKYIDTAKKTTESSQ